MIKKLFNLIFCSLLLMSCSLEPPYRPPIVDLPESWKTTPKVNEEEEDKTEEDEKPSFESLPLVQNWWKVFQDETLDCLEAQLLEKNRDFYVAVQRVYESRAIAGIRDSQAYPQLSLAPSYQSIGALVKVFGLPPPLPTIIRTHQIFDTLPLRLNYELDLWGRIKNNEKAAFLEVKAQEMALRASLLMLTADLAANYFQLRSLDSHLKLLEDTIKLRKDILDIIKERYELGFVNYSDVTRAETQFYNAEFNYLDSLRKRALKENMIAVLVGTPSSLFGLEYNPLDGSPPAIPPGIPSEVLLNRPDILEAERRAASENAMIGVAYASFFPSLNLTGVIGFSSPDLKDFLKWKSRLWSVAAESFQPIFDGFRTTSNLELSFARFHKASGTYQQTVLVAFREVEDALINLKLQAKEMEKLEKSAELTKVTTEISMDRYLTGFVNYLDVADSLRMELESQSGVIDLTAQQYISTIELIKALGGSW